MTMQTILFGDAIKAIMNHFITLGGFPAISEAGSPMYQSKKGNGCFIFTIASEGLRKMISEFSHQEMPACNLADRISFIDKDGHPVHSNRMQEIQIIHDVHGAIYHTEVNSGIHEGVAHDKFCRSIKESLVSYVKSNPFFFSDVDIETISNWSLPIRSNISKETLQASAPKFNMECELVTT